MRTVDQCMSDMFQPCFNPRSEAYKLGALSVLRLKLENTQVPAFPYVFGTSEADAYFAGQQAAHFYLRPLFEQEAAK